MSTYSSFSEYNDSSTENMTFSFDYIFEDGIEETKKVVNKIPELNLDYLNIIFNEKINKRINESFLNESEFDHSEYLISHSNISSSSNITAKENNELPLNENNLLTLNKSNKLSSIGNKALSFNENCNIKDKKDKKDKKVKKINLKENYTESNFKSILTVLLNLVICIMNDDRDLKFKSILKKIELLNHNEYKFIVKHDEKEKDKIYKNDKNKKDEDKVKVKDANKEKDKENMKEKEKKKDNEDENEDEDYKFLFKQFHNFTIKRKLPNNKNNNNKLLKLILKELIKCKENNYKPKIKGDNSFTLNQNLQEKVIKKLAYIENNKENSQHLNNLNILLNLTIIEFTNTLLEIVFSENIKQRYIKYLTYSLKIKFVTTIDNTKQIIRNLLNNIKLRSTNF